MVSTIANGGMYLPPRILLQSTDELKGDARLKPAAFHPANQLSSNLPKEAHRVISELTAAKMRDILRGTVTEGTGSLAKLNGYSSGGKTGTANKVDLVTHTYSHTKLVASFAGMAPVSNPAIAIAVVIDQPGTGTGYGGVVSAPVFAQVAQQVLEYLGVPHDIPLQTRKEQLLAQAAAPKEVFDSSPEDNGADLNAMFADVNELPADDPLRNPAKPVAPTEIAQSAPMPVKPRNGLSDTAMKTFRANGNTTSVMPGESVVAAVPVAAPVVRPTGHGIIVDSGPKVSVPSFEGVSLRTVLERAGASGLRVQPVGSGLAREQAPAPGTMVPAGTEVVVRFVR